MRKILFLFTFLALQQSLLAQDPQFTQFYAAPLYHNPAFTGSGYAPRVIMNYRNQWPSLNANFITTAFSFDHFIKKYNSGIGFMFLNDKQGYNLSNNEIRLTYAYELKLNRDNGLRLGLNLGYSFRGLNPNGLIFGDQLKNNGYTGRPTDDPLGTNDKQININTFDFGLGGLYFNKDYYIGLSVNHIREPDLAFVSNESKLPRIIMVNGGYNINLDHLISTGPSDREFTITPTFLYKKQGQYSQLDLGTYVTYSPLTFGVQYRGVPLAKVFNAFPNQDALSGMVGVRYENFSFGYSYDLTISGLGASSGGSHEVSVSYLLPQRDDDIPPRYKSRKKMLKCPKF